MSNIVITLGPATSTHEKLREVIRAGADAFRFPASKVPVRELAELAVDIAGIADEFGRHPDLLLDLPGSKTRFTNDREFSLDAAHTVRVRFDPGPSDLTGAVPELGLSGAYLGGSLTEGDLLLIGDGEDALRVAEVFADHCIAVPLTSGVVGRRRGVVLQGKMPPAATFTEQDVEGLRKLPSTIFSAVILSFVESGSAVEQARSIMREAADGQSIPAVMAKIETRAGVMAAREIAESADAVLLGRGDMLLEGGELDFHELSEMVIKVCAEVGCPVVIGTQLLESLSYGWLPHRSELAYVSQMWARGIGGMLLANETAIGRQPVRTVELLSALRGRYALSPEGKPMFPARREQGR